jgi:hypothetical protein
MVQRLFKFDINKKYLLSLVIFVTGVILFTFFVDSFRLDWKSGFIIGIAGSFLFAVVLRLINFKAILGLLRNN